MVVILFLYRGKCAAEEDARYYVLDKYLADTKAEATVYGKVNYYEKKSGSYALYLKSNYIFLKSSKHYLKDIIIYVSEKPDVLPGQQIVVNGIISEFEIPANPGQFNQKQYFKEKNIYYKMAADSIVVKDYHYNKFKKWLLDFKEKWLSVYESVLPEKESGTVCAMILGEKSMLDMDVKTLYQQSGIGHLLAISGLHVTIIFLSFYKFLIYIQMPRKCAIPVTILLLTAYGSLTGFSISTSRAVIMMVTYLMAEFIGRTYDMLSALALSAIIICLQRPSAIYSCSFLMSFGAIAGILFVLPVIEQIVFKSPQRKKYIYSRGQKYLCYIKRVKRIIEKKTLTDCERKELKRQYTIKFAGIYIKYILNGIFLKLLDIFLSSLAIQIALLPVMLWFYYEIPAYAIVINIFVIPFAAVLVIVSVAGGLIGIVCLPVAKYILGSAYVLLNFYSLICDIFSKFPNHMIIAGKPDIWQILLYYIILIVIYCIYRFYKETEFDVLHNIVCISGMALSFAVVIYTAPVKNLKVTFLDVGQGDCIFIQNNKFGNCIIDGGSSSVKEVGKYRILPFLKSNGVNVVDYMIMTHADADHINGLEEILNQSESGVKVKNFIIPEPADSIKEEGYYNIIKTAAANGVSVSYIHQFEGLRDNASGINLICLNPPKDFVTDSVNAYSTVISLTYGKASFLFTGDMEKEGEKNVIDILSDSRLTKKMGLPQRYDVLKAAHHGSKNSTTSEFLERTAPKLAVISCGKKNRYGHPHAELLERLDSAGAKVVRTDESGAVTVSADGEGKKLFLNFYINSNN